MAQNPHNAVMYLGHQNGTVTLWTPNIDEPAVKLLAHLGGVTSLSVDPSSAGRYMATAGMDGKVKVWDCRNWKGCVREWEQRGTGHAELDWSQKGFLGVASGGTVNVRTSSAFYTCFSLTCHLRRFTPQKQSLLHIRAIHHYTSPTQSHNDHSPPSDSVPTPTCSPSATRVV